VPFPDKAQEMRLYVRAELIHSGGDKEWYTEKKQCSPTEDGFADVMFDQKFEFTFDTEELVFLRYEISILGHLGYIERIRQTARQPLCQHLEG
jgi:hypothetical protein